MSDENMDQKSINDLFGDLNDFPEEEREKSQVSKDDIDMMFMGDEDKDPDNLSDEPGEVSQSEIDAMFDFNDDSPEEPDRGEDKEPKNQGMSQDDIDALFNFDTEKEVEAEDEKTTKNDEEHGENPEIIHHSDKDATSDGNEEQHEFPGKKPGDVMEEFDISDFIDMGDSSGDDEDSHQQEEITQAVELDLSDLIDLDDEDAKTIEDEKPENQTIKNREKEPEVTTPQGQDNSILSQDDIDALINSIGSEPGKDKTSPQAKDSNIIGIGGPSAVELYSGSSRDDSRISGRYKLYDFRRPEKLSRDQIRKIKSNFEAMPRYLTNYFAKLIHCPVEINLIDVDQKYYGDIFRAKANPMVTAIFDIEQTLYHGILEFSLHHLYTIIERMLGGEGTVITPPRPMTDFERALSQEIFLTALDFHKKVLELFFNCNFKINHTDTDTLMIPKTQSENEVFIRLVYNININGIVGYLNICIPYNLLGPYYARYAPAGRKDEQKSHGVTKDKVQAKYGKIRVPLSVEFAKKKISAHQLSGISPGTVISLDHRVDQLLNVVVNGKVKYVAKPGIKGDRLGVKVMGVYENEALV